MRLTARSRAWLVAVAVLAAVLTYLVGWSTYAWTHLSGSTWYRLLPPGRPASVPRVSMRLEALTRTDRLADQRNGGDPARPPVGAVFVVAELEVVISPGGGDKPVCSTELVGPGRRIWQPTAVTGRSLPSSCFEDEVKAGQRNRLETVFAVPERFAGQLVGVAVPDDTSAGRTQVLRPAQ